MSSRVTRSSARISAGSSAAESNHVQIPPNPPPSTALARKRKVSTTTTSLHQSTTSGDSPPRRRAKRAKIEGSIQPTVTPPANLRTRTNKNTSAMSNTDPSDELTGTSPPSKSLPPAVLASTKRKSARSRKADALPPTSSTTRTRNSKKRNQDLDVTMTDEADEQDTPEEKDAESQNKGGHTAGSEPDPAADQSDDDEDGLDPFESGFLRRHGGSSLSHSLRALSGVLSGTTSRLRGLLEKLRMKEDPSIQLIALQEFSELLLVSNEDNLAGAFSPDAYVKELVTLMQPNEFGMDNPEIMLLACRCLANMMEALPSSAAAVVYGGAVPVLCLKLLEIDYIDLAEQALSTLEKISVEFPGHIVREGGLTACLTYLDFFATGTQRTAVTTAANCCRNIPEESFAVVRDVMPTLLNVLNSSDQRVLEQGCLCVSRIVESFRWSDSKLEELVDKNMLAAINRLLLPGTTNLIGANIHTLFLRVLGFVARSSPLRSVEMLKMNIVDTLYQILTGVSPPSGDQDVAARIDPVMVMQALIHRPRDQIFETLNVICELLPDVSSEGLLYVYSLVDAGFPGRGHLPMSADAKKPKNEERIKLLAECKDELRRFTVILLPTLTDAYSSTVNLAVRQKVLTAHLKMLSNVDTHILEDALRNVSYSSFLAAILSQQDHYMLVTYALQAAELLLKRLESIYRYQFYREGVISEIKKLAGRPLKETAPNAETKEDEQPPASSELADQQVHNDSEKDEDNDTADEDNEDEDDDNSNDDEEGEGEDVDDEDDTNSDSTSSPEPPSHYHRPDQRLPIPEDIITQRARSFVEVYKHDGDSMNAKASVILDDLKKLMDEIKACSLDSDCNDLERFSKLAAYFDQDELESITSYELLSSDVVNVLFDVLSGSGSHDSTVQSAFLQAFMSQSTPRNGASASSTAPATPFSILVHKLQDLLSRSEHFEVITVHQNGFDSSRGSATSMLAKQLKLTLVTSDTEGIPKPFRAFTVTIHAIATFKALDEFLRQRIAMAERPRPSATRARENLLRAMEMAGAMSSQEARDAFKSAFGAVPGSLPGDLTNRTPKRPSASKTPPTPATPLAQIASGSTPAPASTTRKSSRKTRTQLDLPPVPPPPPPAPAEETGEQIECADEAQLSDDDTDDDATLNALVNDLEDEMQTDEEEPSAVNMEIASTGKVTACRDDGTRIATPFGNKKTANPTSQGAKSAFNPFPPPAPPSAASTPSRMSYAAAIQSVPQDWHLEFSVNGQRISNDMTVYRAVHFDQSDPSDVSSRNIWSANHQITYKKVTGPPPVEQPTRSSTPEPSTEGVVPTSIARDPTTAAILGLLSLLHGLNSNPDDVVADKKDASKLTTEPPSQFVNTKLTAKLNRQLEEPLIVSSNCLPNWAEDLARLYPFLFPFETRHLFLQSTSFGYSRSMNRWQSSQANESRHDRHRDDRPYLGKPQRQKVRISRYDILKAAIKVMELYGASPAILEVEYFEEVGTGLGPTLEFYSTVSKEFAKKKLRMWRENESAGTGEYAFGTQGLFPAPMSDEFAKLENGKKILALFESMGKFVARSMLDSRIIDISFNPTFFRIGLASGVVPPSIGAVRSVDNDLANSLQQLRKFVTAKKSIEEDSSLDDTEKASAIQAIEMNGAKVEDLALDFTLPGYPSIELIPGGSDTAVTIDNVSDYIDSVINMTVESGIRHQLSAFKAGFSEVFPFVALRAFTPAELVMLFGRTEEDWSLETLMDSIKADHGFNLDSRSVKNLLTVMSNYNESERRAFLLFVTGSPKLPIGGFKSLTPMFTVVCKPSEAPYTSDDYLPSVMTCVNYLKLPDYSSVDIMKDKLGVAIREGQGAFHLS